MLAVNKMKINTVDYILCHLQIELFSRYAIVAIAHWGQEQALLFKFFWVVYFA